MAGQDDFQVTSNPTCVLKVSHDWRTEPLDLSSMDSVTCEFADSAARTKWELSLYPNGDESDQDSRGFVCLAIRMVYAALGYGTCTLSLVDDKGVEWYRKTSPVLTGNEEHDEPTVFVPHWTLKTNIQSSFFANRSLTIRCTIELVSLEVLNEIAGSYIEKYGQPDLTIVLSQGELKAHKAVFANAATALQAPLSSKQGVTVLAMECSPETMRDLLYFLYHGPDTLKGIKVDRAGQLLLLAQQHQICSLTQLLKPILLSHLHSYTAVLIHVVAAKSNATDLLHMVTQYIKDNADRVNQKTDWTEVRLLDITFANKAQKMIVDCLKK